VISSDYFGFRRIEHPEECTQPGWEVHERYETNGDEVCELVIRIVCPQPRGCGTWHEWKAGLCRIQDPASGDPHGGMTTQGGPVERIGYGTAPIRCAGVWLHAGAPMLRGEDPEGYLVTGTAERPRRWQDVLGIMGRVRVRGRQSKRWFAAAGLTKVEYTLPSWASHTEQLGSRTAATRWVVEQAAATPAAPEPPAPHWQAAAARMAGPILRRAAELIEEQAHELVDVVQTITMAAAELASEERPVGPLTNVVVRHFAAHLRYRTDRDPAGDLTRWASLRTRDVIVGELRRAAQDLGGSPTSAGREAYPKGSPAAGYAAGDGPHPTSKEA
jgi:hypothetical protein